MVNKIAFLFLTVNDVNFPEIWNFYFNDNKNKINIYSHVKIKDNIKSDFIKNNIIDNQVDTKWGFLVEAEIELLKEAIKDKDNKYFILLSETCLPIKSFDNLYRFLFDNDNLNKSYIEIRDETETEKDIKYLFDKKGLEKYFNKNYKFTKHSQWFCLSRYHVEKLLNNKIINKFKYIHAGDELMLSVLFPDDNINDFAINYSNWKNKNQSIVLTNRIKDLWSEYDKTKNIKLLDKIKQLTKLRNENGKHPMIYSYIDAETIKSIENMESFFLRKFDKHSNIIDYYKILIY